MTASVDRPYDWVAALAYWSAVAVIVPSMMALAISLLAVAWRLL